jgi:flagellar basal-body rod protein FlgC
MIGAVLDPRDFRRVYQPGHPEADADGIVAYPNVNIVEEMVDLVSATRSYEANAAAFNAAKTMAQNALDLGRA